MEPAPSASTRLIWDESGADRQLTIKSPSVFARSQRVLLLAIIFITLFCGSFILWGANGLLYVRSGKSYLPQSFLVVPSNSRHSTKPMPRAEPDNNSHASSFTGIIVMPLLILGGAYYTLSLRMRFRETIRIQGRTFESTQHPSGVVARVELTGPDPLQLADDVYPDRPKAMAHQGPSFSAVALGPDDSRVFFGNRLSESELETVLARLRTWIAGASEDDFT